MGLCVRFCAHSVVGGRGGSNTKRKVQSMRNDLEQSNSDRSRCVFKCLSTTSKCEPKLLESNFCYVTNGEVKQSQRADRQAVARDAVLLSLTAIHIRVTAAARKESWSFCPKCRWLITAKHACTLRMWLCMKRRDMEHGCMVNTERAETAAVSSGTSHVTTKQKERQSQTDIMLMRWKKKRSSDRQTYEQC